MHKILPSYFGTGLVMFWAGHFWKSKVTSNYAILIGLVVIFAIGFVISTVIALTEAE